MHAGGHLVVGEGIRRAQPGEDRLDLRARLPDRSPVGEPPLDEEPARPPAIEARGAGVPIGLPLHAGEHEALDHRDRHPELGGDAWQGAGKSHGCDADDGGLHPREVDVLADNRRVEAKTRPPRRVAQHHQRRGAGPSVIAFHEPAAERHPDTEHVEVVRRDGLARDQDGALHRGEDAADVGSAGQPRKGVGIALDVEVVGIGRGQLGKIRAGAAVDLDQPIALGQRVVPEEDRVDHGKERGVEANPQRQREHGRGRQPRAPRELSNAVPDIPLASRRPLRM